MIRFKSEQRHQREVKRIQRAVASQKGETCLSNTLSSNTLRNCNYKKKDRLIDLSHLNSVVALSTENEWVLVEPKITIQALCRLTMSYNLIPPVVPEFTSITVGGAIMGAALESASHRFGQFNDICLEYEVILGNGELVRANSCENSDLFYGISGSYGTLGILTLAKIGLVRAKKYVHLTYHRFSNLKAITSFLTSPQKADFVEGVVIDRNWSVAILGKMTSRLSLPVYRQNHFFSPWYLQHIVKVTKKETFEEIMPLEEYLFRLDRGAFWMGRFVLSFPLMLRVLSRWNLKDLSKRCRAFAQTLEPTTTPSTLFRFLFGWALTSKRLYKIWHKIPNSITENLFFVHDFYTPFSKTNEVLELFLDKTEIFPVWLCPIRKDKTFYSML